MSFKIFIITQLLLCLMCRYRERRERNYGALLPFGCKSFYYLTVIYRAGPIEKNGRQDEGIGWPEITFTANFYDILLSSAFALPTRRVCLFYLLLLHLDLRCLSFLHFLVLTFSLVMRRQFRVRCEYVSDPRIACMFIMSSLAFHTSPSDPTIVVSLLYDSIP